MDPEARPPSRPNLPELPLASWAGSRTTLHLYLQVVGKIRLALHPKLNHWWHVPLYVSTRGLTTRSMPIPTDPHGRLELMFDFLDHDLVIQDDRGHVESVELHHGHSVSQFHRAVFDALRELGVKPDIRAEPFDPARTGSDVPFARDDVHADYDPDSVRRFWRILAWSERVFTEFSGRFTGKSTPVHLFWHSLDLALTRFSGRRAPRSDGVDPVTREAYSHEVISFGVWAGDATFPGPTYYAYVAPEPDGLSRTRLAPEAAYWHDTGGGSLAILSYDDVRRARDPRLALLDFLESSYRAGASRAGWDMDGFANEFVPYTPPDAVAG